MLQRAQESNLLLQLDSVSLKCQCYCHCVYSACIVNQFNLAPQPLKSFLCYSFQHYCSFCFLLQIVSFRLSTKTHNSSFQMLPCNKSSSTCLSFIPNALPTAKQKGICVSGWNCTSICKTLHYKATFLLRHTMYTKDGHLL